MEMVEDEKVLLHALIQRISVPNDVPNYVHVQRQSFEAFFYADNPMSKEMHHQIHHGRPLSTYLCYVKSMEFMIIQADINEIAQEMLKSRDKETFSGLQKQYHYHS